MPLFLPFDLDLFQRAVAQKPLKKWRHSSHLQGLAADPDETTGQNSQQIFPDCLLRGPKFPKLWGRGLVGDNRTRSTCFPQVQGCLIERRFSL